MKDSMENIVFINQSSGYLTIENINEFALHYKKIALIYGTMTPNQYPLNTKVEKVRIIKKTRKSNIGKVIRWLVATIQIHFLLLFKFRDYEIFYYTLPPFSYLSSLFLKRKFSLMVFDVYPDILKSFKIGERNPLYKLWAKANRMLFPRAHRVYTISDGLATILSQYIPPEKIKVVSVWGSISNLKQIPKYLNPFTKSFGFEDKFIVQYSGNIGQAHNVEILLELARELQGYPKIHFVIIGRGRKIKVIKDQIEKYKLTNCVLLPFQPEEMIRYSLSNADIGVVMIDQKAALLSVPSKVYNMMAAGSALLAIAPRNSELFNIIDKYGNGKCFNESELESIKQFIIDLSMDPDSLAKYKNNSTLASATFTSENAKKIYLSYIN